MLLRAAVDRTEPGVGCRSRRAASSDADAPPDRAVVVGAHSGATARALVGLARPSPRSATSQPARAIAARIADGSSRAQAVRPCGRRARRRISRDQEQQDPAEPRDVMYADRRSTSGSSSTPPNCFERRPTAAPPAHHEPRRASAANRKRPQEGRRCAPGERGRRVAVGGVTPCATTAVIDGAYEDRRAEHVDEQREVPAVGADRRRAGWSCAGLPDHARGGSRASTTSVAHVEPEGARDAAGRGCQTRGWRWSPAPRRASPRLLRPPHGMPSPDFRPAELQRDRPRGSSAAITQPSQSWYSSREIASQTPNTIVPAIPAPTSMVATDAGAASSTRLWHGLSERPERDDHDREHHLGADERERRTTGGARGSSRSGSHAGVTLVDSSTRFNSRIIDRHARSSSSRATSPSRRRRDGQRRELLAPGRRGSGRSHPPPRRPGNPGEAASCGHPLREGLPAGQAVATTAGQLPRGSSTPSARCRTRRATRARSCGRAIGVARVANELDARRSPSRRSPPASTAGRWTTRSGRRSRRCARRRRRSRRRGSCSSGTAAFEAAERILAR